MNKIPYIVKVRTCFCLTKVVEIPVQILYNECSLSQKKDASSLLFPELLHSIAMYMAVGVYFSLLANIGFITPVKVHRACMVLKGTGRRVSI